MASSKDYLTFVLEQLSDLEGITYRAMRKCRLDCVNRNCQIE